MFTLTAQIKLLPNGEQDRGLRETLETSNRAANHISKLAWESKQFNRFGLQKIHYRTVRDDFSMSAQSAVRIFAKVADAYRIDQKTQRIFRNDGGISYDSRILSFKLSQSLVSIWTVAGRQRIPFVCGDVQRKLLELPRGGAVLILRDGKWFLNVTVDVPEEREREATGWLGVDLGIKNIATDSDGANYSGAHLNALRHRHSMLRAKLQARRTKSAKRLLRRRRRKESRFSSDLNHQISKRIVEKAKCTGRGISLEDLTGIRLRIKARKAQRRQIHSWAFFDLREKIAYKAKRAGVPVRLVDPRNTSRRCAACGHTEKANRRSRDEFRCRSCGHSAAADNNAAENISVAAVIQPNIGTMDHGVPTSRHFTVCL